MEIFSLEITFFTILGQTLKGFIKENSFRKTYSDIQTHIFLSLCIYQACNWCWVTCLQIRLGWTETAMIAGARDVGVSPSIVGSFPRKEAALVEVNDGSPTFTHSSGFLNVTGFWGHYRAPTSLALLKMLI